MQPPCTKDKCHQIAKETTSFDVMDFNDFQDFYERFASPTACKSPSELRDAEMPDTCVCAKAICSSHVSIAFHAVVRYERQALQMKLKRPDEVVLVSLDP